MQLRRPAAVVLAVASTAALVPAAHAKAPRAADARQTSYVHESGASSIDWGDAGIGAGGALAVLVAAGSAAGLTISRRRQAGLAVTRSA